MFTRVRAWLELTDIRTYPLYSAAIFLSAFLLFQVQPMIARYLLPFFGGAVSVWASSLVFFTSVLFFGYVYVYILSHFPARTQVRTHLALLALAALTTLGSLVLISGPYRDLHWVIQLSLAPALQVLIALAASIGIPYFALSTTGPLLQHWYGREVGKEPYHLYALSNVGSLLALVSYPFVTEPLLGLNAQSHLWSVAFLACLGLLASVAWRHHTTLPDRTIGHALAETVPMQTLLSWLGLAALPAIMLVATTARITQTLTPFPFLWVIPLALYLLSFILAFRGWGAAGTTAFAVLVATFASYTYMDWSFDTTSYQIIANLSLFFVGSLYCHALLYRARPVAELSAFYYVWISLGGAAGTLIVTLIAPSLFVDITEFPLGVAALAFAAIAFFPALKYVRDEYAREVTVIKGALLIGVLMLTSQLISNSESGALESSRNFFGVVHVYEYGGMRSLHHGTTMHGTQFLDPPHDREATTYYSPTSGIGRAVINAQVNESIDATRVGVVGLGAGTLAAYCDLDDVFTFYEIDTRIGRIANDYFTYLSGCPTASIIYGDGRLSLAKQLEEGNKGNFDVLAIDAFSDDTIPVHLLTKEAVQLYLSHLRSPESVLAIHTSNRFFELSPIVMRIAVELGLSAMVINDSPSVDGATLSQWVLLSQSAETLQKPVFADAASPPLPPSALWTDDYANVFAALDKTAFGFMPE